MSGAVKSRTDALGLALLRFDFPNWGDDMNKNQQIIDASYSIFGIAIGGAWDNSTIYTAGMLIVDPDENNIYRCNISHTSAASGTFAADRIANPTYWSAYNSTIRYRNDWTTATQYYANETFTHQPTDDAWYIVTASHISGDFEDDLADGLFSVFFDPTDANDSAEASAAAAAVSAAAALVSQNAAAASQSTASTAATTATTQAGNASTSAGTASTAATTATTQAGNASSSASAASTSAGTASTAATTATTQAGIATAAAAIVAQQEKHGIIMIPQNADEYIVGLRMRHAGTITRSTTKCLSGSCTATIRVNGSAIGQAAHSVSTSEQSIARTSGNTFAAGDDISILISSNSGCVQMVFSIEYDI